MKKQIIYLLFTIFAFVWQGNAQCNYTLEMNDSYGDGWNGNTMDVLVNGTVVLDDVTLDDGQQGTMQFQVTTGDDISTVWNGGGSYGSETSYRILDADGIEVGAASEADIPSGTITASCPSCLAPQNLTVSNTTDSTADLSWDDLSGGGATYTVEWRETGTTNWNSDTTAAGATSYTVSGLTPHTNYEWQLTADCGGGDTSSTPAGPTFWTACSVVSTFPYDYGFEDTTTNTEGDWASSCWSGNPENTGAGSFSGPYRWTSQDGSTPSSSTGPSAAHTGNQYAFTEASGSSAGDVAELISPNFDLSSLTSPQLVFYYHMYGGDMGELHVDTYDGTTWTTDVWSIAGEQQADPSDPWAKAFVSIPANVTQIKFRGIRGGGYNSDIAIDDISIRETPPCPEPLNLVVDTVSMTSADVSWTDASAGSGSFIVEWREVGAGTWNSATVAAGTTTYQITGLTERTNYEWQVTTDCGGTGTSPSTAGPNFYTWYCDSVPSSFDGNGITNVQIGTTDFANSPASYNDFSTGTVVDLPQGEVANLQITFETGYTYDTNVWIDFNDDLIFDNATELVFQGESTSDNPTTLDASFIMPNTAPLGNHIMRIGSADTGQATPDPCYNGSWGVTLDFAINVTPPPSCPSPSDLAVNNIGSTSADLAWTDNTGGTATYTVEWRESGAGTWNSATTAAGATTYTLTGLNSHTDYEWQISADCGGGDTSSVRVGPNFQTTCDIVSTFPYNYGFEDMTANTEADWSASCWSANPQDTGAGQFDPPFRWTPIDGPTPSSNTGPAGPYSGNLYAYTEASGSDTGDVAELISPVFDMSSMANGVELIFHYYMFGADIGELHVDTYDGTAWTTDAWSIVGPQQMNDSEPWTEVFVNLPNTVTQIKFRAVRGAGYHSDIAIDDITLREAPTCPTPTDLVVLNTSGDTADLAWTDNTNGNASYIIEYRELGATAWNSATTPVGASSYTLTGLTPLTGYEWQLTADCGGGDTSYLATGGNFYTGCMTVDVFPYEYGFEDVFTNTGGDWTLSCWNGNPQNTNADASSGPYRWTSFNGPTPTSGTGPDLAHSGTQYAYTEADGSSYGEVAELISPNFDMSALSTPELSFYYHMHGDDIGSLHVDTYDGTSWTTDVWMLYGPQQQDMSDPWELVVLPLSNDVVKIKFRATRGNGDKGDIAIDDISIHTCRTPTDLNVDSISTTSADVSWTDNSGGVAEYLVEWREAGTTTWNSATTAAGATTYQITGLTEKTEYEWQITANCSANQSSLTVGSEFYTWYCDSTPVSNDGNGITNVRIRYHNYPIEDVPYKDLTNDTVVELKQGDNADMDITFETGVEYAVNIWIDYNDNLSFDTDELVFSGQCTTDIPSLVDSSFMVDAGANLGEHIMRIGARDAGLYATPDPCFNDYWGVTIDLKVNIVDVLGITDDNTDFSFNLYPNPVDNVLNVTSDKNIQSLQVYDLLGQEIMNVQPESKQYSINVDYLKAGTYMVRVVVDQQAGFYRFIKK